MKITILKEEERYMKFVIDSIKDSEINAIRRTLLREIPKLAIEKVEFHLGSIGGENGEEYESMTPLFNEVIAHRLSMVPLPTDISRFKFRNECSCGGQGCPLCTVMYTINVKGDKKDEMVTVYSGDMKVVGNDPSLEVIDKKIPIVKLAHHQALLLYAIAELGRGKDHAKWKVANAVGYSEYPEIKINNKKCKDCQKCVDVCPPKILAIKNNELVVTDETECILCNLCVKACPDNSIEVKGNKTKYIFQFETDGSWTARKALLYALQLLKDQFNEIAKLTS